MDDAKRVLSGTEVLSANLDDWRQLRSALHTRWLTGNFVTGLALVNDIAAAAESAGHHPDLDLRYPYLDVVLTSHDVSGVTSRDLSLATEISRIAATHGVQSNPLALSSYELALDTAGPELIGPFWQALLATTYRPEQTDVVDRTGRLPDLWFQSTDPHDPPRQRFHLDVYVPHDAAEQRVAAALASGGTLVTDEWAPSFWVLADPDGNKACVCTWQEAAN